MRVDRRIQHLTYIGEDNRIAHRLPDWLEGREGRWISVVCFVIGYVVYGMANRCVIYSA